MILEWIVSLFSACASVYLMLMDVSVIFLMGASVCAYTHTLVDVHGVFRCVPVCLYRIPQLSLHALKPTW